MYGHFIYFILILLVYTTYVPPQETYLGPLESVGLFFILLWVFAATTKAAFLKLRRRIRIQGPYGLHGTFDRIVTQQAIVAVIVFTLDVYVLNLKLLVFDIPFLSASPTVMAFLFICLFMGYLTVVWYFAHQAYGELFGTSVSKSKYIRANIALNLPVILPWLIISLVTDLITALPFDGPKAVLASQEGQVFFFSCFLGLLIVVAPSLIKTFWQCKPLEAGAKRHKIELMCREAGLGYRDILDWPIFEGRMLSAGIMGLVKRFRYILVTKSLLQILDDEELDAVVAHEIGHIKRKHLVFYLVFFLGFIVLSYSVFDLVLYGILYSNLALPMTRGGGVGELSTLTSILFTGALAVILLFYFRFVFGYFMRNCERQADLFAFQLIGHSRGLISSLEKIAVYSGNSHDRPSWHHFSIRQRIDYLKKCEADRRWIAKHDNKLRRSVGVFLLGLFSVGYLGYAINFGDIGKILNSRFLEKALVKEIENNPSNPALHYMLGTIHYQQEDFEEAIASYEKTVALAPHHAEALNNLAWLYATCKVEALRSPIQALVYAQTAAALKPAPHILDTLAESYYINGLYQQAVEAIKVALTQNPEDQEYYEGQLEKFEEALGRENKEISGSEL